MMTRQTVQSFMICYCAESTLKNLGKIIVPSSDIIERYELQICKCYLMYSTYCSCSKWSTRCFRSLPFKIKHWKSCQILQTIEHCQWKSSLCLTLTESCIALYECASSIQKGKLKNNTNQDSVKLYWFDLSKFWLLNFIS